MSTSTESGRLAAHARGFWLVAIAFAVGMAFSTVPTPPEGRGEAAAGIFLAAYIGLTVPVVLVGIATRFLSLPAAMTGFAAIVVVACVVLSLRLFRRSPVVVG